MKRFAFILTAALTSLLLPGCATLASWQQNSTVQAIEKVAGPLAQAAVTAAAASLGVPPTATAAGIAAFGALWGSYAQVQAGQPAANGTSIKPVASTIEAALASLTPEQKIAVLQAAANLIQK